MTLEVIPDLANGLMSAFHSSDPSQGLAWHLSFDWTVIAQQFNQDILADLQKAFNNFVKTGQVWAFLIGIILGYLFKSFTSFG